jgi:hypothetical protein
MVFPFGRISAMRKFVMLLLLFFIKLFIPGQTFPPGSYTNCGWDKVEAPANYIKQEGDTAIVFVSVRHYRPGKEQFLDYGLDTNALHYFTIFFNHNKWVAIPKNSLKEAYLAADPGNDVVVYAEGLGKTFTGTLDRATRFTRTYHVTTIMFDWPTFNPVLKGGENYRHTLNLSKPTAKVFSRFLDSLNTLKKELGGFNNLTLFLHSMGNLLMMHSIQQNYLNVKDTLFGNVVLNAACVPQKNHAQWVEKINIQEKIYITRNNHDRSLNGAKIISFFQRQLGERPRPPYAMNAQYINFSTVLSFEHNYFLYDRTIDFYPQIGQLYSSIFHGRKPAFDDVTKFRKRRSNYVDLVKQDITSKDLASPWMGL